MIERIFIPTVNRINNQVTYNSLPEELKKRVTFVVQAWEAEQYKFDADYFVLPDTPEYHFKDLYCIARTRKLIYELGKGMKYLMIDDDFSIIRRNTKYFGLPSSMEKSQRRCTEQDFFDLFDMMDSWLDEPDVTICSLGSRKLPPEKKIIIKNKGATGASWINGIDLANENFDDWDLLCVSSSEDINFSLTALSRGYGTKQSSEFVRANNSVERKMTSLFWENHNAETVWNDGMILQKKFPGIYTVLVDENGSRISGGHRGFGKNQIKWTKAYNSAVKKGTGDANL
jgi:hypothetical protein